MKKDNRARKATGRPLVAGAIALGLIGSLAGPAAAAAQGGTVIERLEAWRLEVATGVLSRAARAELDALAKDAEAAAMAEGAGGAARDAWARVQAERRAIAPKAAVAARQGAQVAPEEEVLRRSILLSLKSSNREFISRVGIRAVPALAALAKATDGSPTPEGELDPLEMLFSVDVVAGMDAALELMSSESFLIKRATVGVLNIPIQNSRLYRPVGDTDWEFVKPEWGSLAKLVVAEPAVSAAAATSVIQQLLDRGLLPRELKDLALEALPELAFSNVVPEAGLWWCQLQLAHPNPDVRKAGITGFLRSGKAAPVLPLVHDPSREVREYLAALLLNASTSRYVDRSGGNRRSYSKVVYLPFDPPLFEAFKTLAMSEDADVSRSIWDDSNRRLGLGNSTKLSGAQLRALLPLAKTADQFRHIANHARGIPETERAALVKDVVASAGQAELYGKGLERFEYAVFRLAQGLTQVERGQLLRVYARHFEATGEKAFFPVESLIQRPLIEDPKVLVGLLRDHELTSRGRVWALRILCAIHQASIDGSLVQPMAAALVGFDDGSLAGKLLGQLSSRDLANQVVRAIVESPDSSDGMVLAMGFAPDDETFDVLIKRFPVETWGPLGFPEQLRACLGVLIDRSEEQLHPLLKTIHLSGDSLILWMAKRIAANRTPALFPLARRLLTESRPDSAAWQIAVDAVAGYFNDEAAGALLEAARNTRNEDSRQRVMVAIREITEWREAAAAWQKSVGAEAKRGAAIEALVLTLEDKTALLEARAASMRGLGLLGAVEELPRIIAALSSPEEEMQAAARAALKRLEE